MADYERRLRRLETIATAPEVEPIRILRTIVHPVLGVTGAFAEGRLFDRHEGESEMELQNRVETCLGWPTQSAEEGRG